jgi:hypothetical protein
MRILLGKTTISPTIRRSDLTKRLDQTDTWTQLTGRAKNLPNITKPASKQDSSATILAIDGNEM